MRLTPKVRTEALIRAMLLLQLEDVTELEPLCGYEDEDQTEDEDLTDL